MANAIPKIAICPQCSKEVTVTTWENIDSLQDPMLRQQILDRNICDFKCPYCECTAEINYDLCYNMRDHGIMIHRICDMDHALDIIKQIEELEKTLDDKSKDYLKKYIHRIVPDINSMREKILIFEHQLDDRVIELMKIIYAGQVLEQLKVEPKHILFDVLSNGENEEILFAIYDDTTLITFAKFDKNLYNSLLHSKRKLKPIRNERLYFVNKIWALESTK